MRRMLLFSQHKMRNTSCAKLSRNCSYQGEALNVIIALKSLWSTVCFTKKNDFFFLKMNKPPSTFFDNNHPALYVKYNVIYFAFGKVLISPSSMP